jgi:hypothetical protein
LPREALRRLLPSVIRLHVPVFSRDHASLCPLIAGEANAPCCAIPMWENDASCPRLSFWPYCRLR